MRRGEKGRRIRRREEEEGGDRAGRRTKYARPSPPTRAAAVFGSRPARLSPLSLRSSLFASLLLLSFFLVMLPTAMVYCIWRAAALRRRLLRRCCS